MDRFRNPKTWPMARLTLPHLISKKIKNVEGSGPVRKPGAWSSKKPSSKKRPSSGQNVWWKQLIEAGIPIAADIGKEHLRDYMEEKRYSREMERKKREDDYYRQQQKLDREEERESRRQPSRRTSEDFEDEEPTRPNQPNRQMSTLERIRARAGQGVFPGRGGNGVGGSFQARGGTGSNSWKSHVENVRSKLPHLSLKEALQLASQSYR